MEHVSRIFAALSDPVRLRILALLKQEKELCVCELVGALALSQPKISRHCRTLSDARLVKSRRHAQWILYSLADNLPPWTVGALDAAVAGVATKDVHQDDCVRLKSVERPAVRENRPDH